MVSTGEPLRTTKVLPELATRDVTSQSHDLLHDLPSGPLNSPAIMIRATLSLAWQPRNPILCRRFGCSPPCQVQERLPSSQSHIVSKLDFFNSVVGGNGQIPTYRVLDGVGKLIDGAAVPEVHLTLNKLYCSESIL